MKATSVKLGGIRAERAYHEAGHVVVASHLGWEIVDTILIPPKEPSVGYKFGEQGGRTRFSHYPPTSKAERLQQIHIDMRITCAGRAAEARFLGQDRGLITGKNGVLLPPSEILWDDDMVQATKLAEQAAGHDSQMQVERLAQADFEARRLVADRWGHVRTVAEALLKHQRMKGTEIQAILRGPDDGAVET